jgi:hypothetical protein
MDLQLPESGHLYAGMLSIITVFTIYMEFCGRPKFLYRESTRWALCTCCWVLPFLAQPTWARSARIKQLDSRLAELAGWLALQIADVYYI